VAQCHTRLSVAPETDGAPEPGQQFPPLALKWSRCICASPSTNLPFAITHNQHMDLGIVLDNAEFFVPPKLRGDLRAMDNMLARQIGDVRVGASYTFSFNGNRSSALFSQGPDDAIAFCCTLQEKVVATAQLLTRKLGIPAGRHVLAHALRYPPAEGSAPSPDQKSIPPL
jgi:hypothetical protein